MSTKFKIKALNIKFKIKLGHLIWQTIENSTMLIVLRENYLCKTSTRHRKLSTATAPFCFGFFWCRADVSCKVNFHVVRSAWPHWYIFDDRVFFWSYVLQHIRLRSFAVNVQLVFQIFFSLIIFFWGAMDSHSKREEFEIFNCNEKNFIAWFLFLHLPPFCQSFMIFWKMVSWHITWLRNTKFLLYTVKDDEYFICAKFWFSSLSSVPKLERANK